MNGENVGCVMLVKDKEPGVARLRLLLVDPKAAAWGWREARRRMHQVCRAAGLHRMTLWTHSVLTAARADLRKAGFTLTSAASRAKSWSQDVVAEYWDLAL